MLHGRRLPRHHAERLVAFEAFPQRRQARGQPTQQRQAKQRPYTARRPQQSDLLHELAHEPRRRRGGIDRHRRGAFRECEPAPGRGDPSPRSRDDEPRYGGEHRRRRVTVARRAGQRRHAECHQSVVPQEQAKQVQQLGGPMMDRCRGHEQQPCPHDASRQRAVATGVRIPEVMGFVDDAQRSGARALAPHGTVAFAAEAFVTADPSRSGKPVHQRPPLRDENGGNDENRRHAERARHRERDVRFAESNSVGQHGAAVPGQDRDEASVGGDLVGREPRRRARRYRREVEQGARRFRARRLRRRFGPAMEEEGERLIRCPKLLSETSGRDARALGGRCHRDDTNRRRDHPPARIPDRDRPSRPRRSGQRRAAGGSLPHGR